MLIELYGIGGVGVDISPDFIRVWVEKHRRRVPHLDYEFVEMDGTDYSPEVLSSFDATGTRWSGLRGARAERLRRAQIVTFISKL